MTARIRLALAVALGLLSSALLPACDMCQVAAAVHQQRCFEGGDQISCEWLDEHYSAGGVCH